MKKLIIMSLVLFLGGAYLSFAEIGQEQRKAALEGLLNEIYAEPVSGDANERARQQLLAQLTDELRDCTLAQEEGDQKDDAMGSLKCTFVITKARDFGVAKEAVQEHINAAVSKR